LQRNGSRRVWGADHRGFAQHRAARVLDKTTSAELLDRLSADEAFGRAAEPWEVAATIAFLASDYSSYLTGEVISVSSQHS
jgi:3-oxoacyl-[acyl-carrier protein] reductase